MTCEQNSEEGLYNFYWPEAYGSCPPYTWDTALGLTRTNPMHLSPELNISPCSTLQQRQTEMGRR